MIQINLDSISIKMFLVSYEWKLYKSQIYSCNHEKVEQDGLENLIIHVKEDTSAPIVIKNRFEQVSEVLFYVMRKEK